MASGASILLGGCAPKQQEAEVSVTVSDSGTSGSGRDTIINNTTIVTPVPPAPDTVIQNNTVIEKRTDTVVRTVPGETTAIGPAIPNEERAMIDRWLKANASTLNEYGDPTGTAYTGATPLFDERTGTRVDVHTYIYMKHSDRPWMSMK